MSEARPAPGPGDGRDDGSRQMLLAGLFQEHGPPLHRYLRLRVGDEADDLVADTFLQAFRSWHTYDSTRGTERTWLFGIASNLIRQHHRQEGRWLRHQAVPEPTDLSVNAPDDETIDRIAAAERIASLSESLLALSQEDRNVLLLSAWADMNATEIGAALGIAAGTVRSRLHRARRFLRDRDADNTRIQEENHA